MSNIPQWKAGVLSLSSAECGALNGRLVASDPTKYGAFYVGASLITERAIEVEKTILGLDPTARAAARALIARRSKQTAIESRLTDREKRLRRAIERDPQAEAEGYCKLLDDAGIQTPAKWREQGCPTTYLQAYTARRWRQRIWDEKAKLFRKIC